MRRRAPSFLLVTAVVGLLAALPSAQAPAPVSPPATTPSSVAFARDIEPIFAKSCWNCHSADAQLADLDLSTREAALRGGEHGAAIVPGNAEQSKLYRMIAGLDSISMPMDGSKLEPAEIAAIKAWIEAGAEWGAPAAAGAKPAAASRSSALAALENMDITPEQRAYWAFKLPVQAAVPQVAATHLHASHRSLPRKRARDERARAGAARRSPHADSPRVPRSHRASADADAGAGVPRRQISGRVDARHRYAARIAALRRALGTPLARRRALCGL